ncbi:hypothetical protein GCM10027262_57810 [Nocardia tengchongensis]
MPPEMIHPARRRPVEIDGKSSGRRSFGPTNEARWVPVAALHEDFDGSRGLDAQYAAVTGLAAEIGLGGGEFRPTFGGEIPLGPVRRIRSGCRQAVPNNHHDNNSHIQRRAASAP